MKRYRRLFLTGATGFFGSHILAELLRSGDGDVICHVRAGGVERVVAALRSYGLWQDAWTQRIATVTGDLGQPGLGLGAAFQRLAGDVDAVIHNGANVNYVLGFKQLRAENVSATQDALRIAEAAGAPFFFVSTLRMFDRRLDGKPIREDDPIDMAAAMAVGYAHTKVMAERLVMAATARGAETAVFRPGLMCGDGVIGAPNQRDAVSLLIRACVQLRAAPDSPMQVNLTSVAYGAQGLVALSRDPACFGQTWHLVNDTPTRMTRVFEALIAAGYPLDIIPYDLWVERLRDANARGDSALAPLVGWFTPGFPAETTGRCFDSTKTHKALAMHGVEHPVIDAAFLEQNIRGMRDCGFLTDINS